MTATKIKAQIKQGEEYVRHVLTRTVRYIDDDTHCILAEDFSRVHDKLVQYSTAATISFFEGRGYTLVSDECAGKVVTGDYTVHMRRV
ncbi:mucin-binding protein [Lacticaseibacillus hulanensis]|uniref:mucin-binding protein n=1 Tax=Lacticaseibacillus hulanensis TaxID=2493111 RepID=UPI000FD74038|nr:hypothetical protein [Lacticaseibacillus hulanensis]